MDRLKAYFPSFAFLVTLAFTCHGIIRLVTGTSPLSWGGVVVANGVFVTVMLALLPAVVSRTREMMPGVVGTATVGGLMTVLGAYLDGLRPLALSEAVVGVGVVYTYVLWYSRLGRRVCPALMPGRPLPDLELTDEDGRPVRTHDFLGQPILLMFYRGNWCPFCVAQIRELSARYAELEERGVAVLLVSPQSHVHTRSIAERFDIAAHFLIDVDGRVARELGILHAAGVPAGFEVLGYAKDTVYPTVVVAGPDGTILWADQTDNYRIRPEPDTFLAVLDGRDPCAEPAAA